MIVNTHIILFVLCAGLNLSLRAQQNVQIKEDLSARWRVFEHGSYVPFSPEGNSGVSVIYFQLKGNEHKRQFLRIASYHNPVVFVNGKLIRRIDQKQVDLSIDSLRQIVSSASLLIALYQKNINVKNLQTYIMTNGAAAENSALQEFSKPPTYFRDFVIAGIFILMTLFVFIIRMNARLTADYFSVIRIFTSHESEDTQLHGRIGNSSNILFYAFCSLIVSFYLVVIFHFVPEHFFISWAFQADSFPMALLQWIKLSGILFILFMVKIFVVYLASALFGLREIFGLHVFNWIRLMLVSCGVMTIFLALYNISRGVNENVYSSLFWFIACILVAWIIILFPKVARRSNFSLFHIFSYLCATEIIPLLVSIKLLYH